MQGDEDISITYDRFIDINSEVTRELVPLIIKTNKSRSSADNIVSRSRENPHRRKSINNTVLYNDNETNQHNNTESLNKLYTAYTNIAVDTLELNIKQTEKSDLNRNYLLSCELIN